MGCRIITGTLDDGKTETAVMYCSTTMWAFGPVFENYEQALDFINWLSGDPRSYDSAHLEGHYEEWLKQRKTLP